MIGAVDKSAASLRCRRAPDAGRNQGARPAPVAIAHLHSHLMATSTQPFMLDAAYSRNPRHRLPAPACTSSAAAPSPQDNLPPSASSCNRIVEFLGGKTLLITGATGFLAKVLVEKIMREQPDVRHLYLLIQPRPDLTPQQRLENIVSQPVFDVARHKYGADFPRLIGAKITAVEGDMSQPNLGMAADVYQRLQQEVDIIVNSAATTSFDERYDVAVRLNTLGALEFAKFGQGCEHLQCLMQVGSAWPMLCYTSSLAHLIAI